MKKNGGNKRNAITRHVFYQLMEWMKPQGPVIKQTKKQLAVAASKHLSVTISTSAIDDALDILKIEIVDPRTGNLNRGGDRVVRLARIVQSIVETLDIRNDLPQAMVDDLKALLVRKGAKTDSESDSESE